MYISTQQFDEYKIKYNWKTIYLGIINGYFSKTVISEYAIKLIENGNKSKLLFDYAYDQIDLLEAEKK